MARNRSAAQSDKYSYEIARLTKIRNRCGIVAAVLLVWLWVLPLFFSHIHDALPAGYDFWHALFYGLLVVLAYGLIWLYCQARLTRQYRLRRRAARA